MAASAGQDVAFACTCGAVKGTLAGVTPKAGSHAQCHCDDCRRAVIWLGQADPGPEGLGYFQTSPKCVTFQSGGDTLAAFAWKSPKLLRWYAPCCNTPLFNTMNNPKWAFASLFVASASDPAAFGPVAGHAFVVKPNGKKGHTGLAGLAFGLVKRLAMANVSGSWRQTPFFDIETRQPVAQVRHLTHEDRAKARL